MLSPFRVKVLFYQLSATASKNNDAPILLHTDSSTPVFHHIEQHFIKFFLTQPLVLDCQHTGITNMLIGGVEISTFASMDPDEVIDIDVV